MFETIQSAFVLILFLVPGLILKSTENLFVYFDRRLSWERYALGLLLRSTLVYLPFAPFIYTAYKENWLDSSPSAVSAAAVFLVVVFPIVLGVVAGYVRRRNVVRRLLVVCKFKLSEKQHIPTAWDSFFGTVKPAFVIVTLNDGSKVYGFMGPGSHVSSDPEERDLYLSAAAQLGENQVPYLVPWTEGVYIPAGQFKTIEFVKEPKPHGQ